MCSPNKTRAPLSGQVAVAEAGTPGLHVYVGRPNAAVNQRPTDCASSAFRAAVSALDPTNWATIQKGNALTMTTTTPGFSAKSSLLRTAGTYQRGSPTEQFDGVSPAQADPLEEARPRTSTDPRSVAVPRVPSAAASIPSIPIYGNWCGPGFGGPGSPIDAVDQACCRHDKCFDANGFDDCKCNRDLIARLPAAIANPNVPASGKAAGAGILAALQLAPCLCHKACLPILGCHDIPGGLGVPGIPGVQLCPPGFA
jgi:hypothetical protein